MVAVDADSMATLEASMTKPARSAAKGVSMPKFWEPLKVALLRKALVLGLSIYNMGLFFLAFIPPSTLVWPERVVMGSSALCSIGLLTHASKKIHLPWEQWSYLLTAFVGGMTLVAFVIFILTSDSPDVPSLTYQVATPLLLLSGIVAAGSAHLSDGGVRRPPQEDE